MGTPEGSYGSSMIRAVLLDCFGVLYLPKSDYWYQALLANPTTNHDEIRDLVDQDEYGLIDDEALFEGIARLSDHSIDQVRRHLVNGFVRNDELVQYVESLRPRYKVALLSNLGHDSSVHYFSAQDRQRLFDEVIISGEVGMIKPHPEIFEYACSKLGVDTSEAVFVDDKETNCIGAREAGLQAIRYTSTQQVAQELQRLLG
jgi:epoxide hydrolase-like predicted phosphatase